MAELNLAAIRARAEAATSEPWEIIGGGEYVTGVGLGIGRECDGGVTSEDAAHIAGMDPTATLALLDRLEAAEAAVERVRALHHPMQIMEDCPAGGCERGDCFESSEGDHLHGLDVIAETCGECYDPDPAEAPDWPCATISAIDGEAGESDRSTPSWTSSMCYAGTSGMLSSRSSCSHVSRRLRL